MTPVEVAKILDTEGSVGAYCGSYEGITPYVAVDMTNITFPQTLHQQFGGTLVLQHPKNPRHSDHWLWQVRGRKCRSVVLYAASELVIKRVQAMYVFLITETFGDHGRRPSKEKVELREKFYVELFMLNRRGRKDATRDQS